MRQREFSEEDAETVALQTVSFLAADEERLERFLSLTGIAPQDLRPKLTERPFLAGILDYLLGDETLLFMFCESTGLAPETPGIARRVLTRK